MRIKSVEPGSEPIPVDVLWLPSEVTADTAIYASRLIGEGVLANNGVVVAEQSDISQGFSAPLESEPVVCLQTVADGGNTVQDVFGLEKTIREAGIVTKEDDTKKIGIVSERHNAKLTAKIVRHLLKHRLGGIVTFPVPEEPRKHKGIRNLGNYLVYRSAFILNNRKPESLISAERRYARFSNLLTGSSNDKHER